MAELIDILHTIIEDSMTAYGMSDLTVGTVTKQDPLEITTREGMAPIPQAALWLTSSVIEKKIPVLAHEHITSGFRHNHTVSGLGHDHTTEEGSTGSALGGSYQTGDGLTPDAYASDQRLEDIVCYEDGKALPVKDGYIILNRGLAVGDKVLLLRVMRGQQFVVLSRIFERRGTSANIAAIQHRPFQRDRIPGSAVVDLDEGPRDPAPAGEGGQL